MSVHVSTDPRDVAAVRARADAVADGLYPQALERLRAGRYLAPALMNTLRHRRDQAVRDLGLLADDEIALPLARVAAVVSLAELPDPSGAKRAASFLSNPSDELRHELLARLNEGVGEIDWSIPGTEKALLDIIRNAEELLALRAATLIPLTKIKGAEAAVIERLNRCHMSNRMLWVGALSGVAQTPEAASRAAQELFRNPPERYWTQSLMYNLYWVNYHLDPAVRNVARTAAREFCLRYLPQERTETLLGDFLQVATIEDLPLLEEIIKSNQPRGYRWIALATLARLDPKQGLKRALSTRGRCNDVCFNIFLDHATEADADRVIRRVRPTERDFVTGDETQLEPTVRLLLRLGEAGRTELLSWIDRLQGNLRTRAEWGLQGITIRQVLEALIANRSLPGHIDDLMEQLRPDSAHELDEGDPSLIAAAFQIAGRGVLFEADNNPITNDRDRMECFTAKQTGGLFVPECAIVEAHGSEPDSRATVQFLHAGRAFRFETTLHKEPNDVAAIVEAANVALEASGHAERFLVYPYFGWMPMLILTDPGQFYPIAERFCLPKGSLA